MKKILIIFCLLISCQSFSQTYIGSKSYIKSYKAYPKDTFVAFGATGYADYPVAPLKDGIYNFVVRTMNNAAKGSYVYIWSPAANVWSSTYMQLGKAYQNVPVKVTLSTTSTYIRLYLGDSASVDNISYVPDSSSIVDLKPILNRISALERSYDSLQPLYIQKGYGTKDNPIKP